MVVPTATSTQKYSNLGMVTGEVLQRKGINRIYSETLAKFANFGVSKSTWSSYRTVANHLDRCKAKTGLDTTLPFNARKTLIFVGWMIEERELKAVSIEKYLSGLRMIHLSNGYDVPWLESQL